MTRLALWFRGWLFWLRAAYLVRSKKHGGGRGSWRFAILAARYARFIVYGQHYRS